MKARLTRPARIGHDPFQGHKFNSLTSSLEFWILEICTRTLAARWTLTFAEQLNRAGQERES
jgi:hypothetical protein